jgi:hypothetical protein
VCDVEYEGQELQHAWAITVHKVRQCGCHFVSDSASCGVVAEYSAAACRPGA